jgi:hypothetical protein
LKIPVGSKVLVESEGIMYEANVCKIQQKVKGKTEFKVHYKGRKTMSQKWIPIDVISPIVSPSNTF